MQTFTATEDELELATRILVSRGIITSCSANDDSDGQAEKALQGDQAKEVFNRSALPFATLRVIWNMSSERGNGELGKYEIAKALRLIGWVQAGEMLSDKLLAVVGPLPTLDGITNEVPSSSFRKGPGSPHIVVFPAVNEDQAQEFKEAFWQAGPVNGFLTEDKIMNAYMTSDLSYEDIQDIINLIDRSNRRLVDFSEFACGLYLVKALQDSQLHSLPSTIPPDIFDQFMMDSSSAAAAAASTPSQVLSPPPPPPYRRQLSSSLSLSPPSPSSSQTYLALSPQPSSRLSKPRKSSPPSLNHHHHQPSSSSLSSATTTTTIVPDVQNNNNNNNEEWEEISQHDRNMFELYFRKLDGNNMGYLDRETFDEFVSVYRVPATDLERIWALTTLDRDEFMKRNEFTIAMHLVKRRSSGQDLPISLPLSILPPSLKSRRNTIAFSSSLLTQKLSLKKPPPPVPPKRRDSLMKGAPLKSVSSTPPISPRPLNPFRQTMSFNASSLSRPSPVSLPPEKSPFEDHDPHSFHMNGIPPRRPQSPPFQPPPPPPPLLPPPTQQQQQQLPTPTSPPTSTASNVVNHERESELLTRSRDEISRLSRQIEVLLVQLEAQTELGSTNEALRLENDILKTQGRDMEKMMADILAVNETESAGFLEKHAQDITRLVGTLGEKEAQCEEQERRIRVLGEDEKELRVKMRESEGVIGRFVAETEGYRQTIELQKEQISELSARVADMSKVLADEPELNRRGGSTTSNRELRVLIRDVTRENDTLKSEVRDMHRSMEQLLLSTKHAKYDEMELENRKLKKTVGELEVMVNQLQISVGVSSSSTSGNNHRRGHDGSDALVRENELLKSQLQDGKRQFVDFRSTSETRMLDLQQKVEELTRENNRLKVDIHHASEGRREDGSVPPPAYDESYVPAE